MTVIITLPHRSLFPPGPPIPPYQYIDGFSLSENAVESFSNGKITFVYVGGEFCPFCAMERWAIVMALEKFGNFTIFPSFISSSEDNIGTYTFHPVSSFSYSSSKVDFEPVEIYSNIYNYQTQYYGSLDTPNNLQNAQFTKYASVSIPFICIGGMCFRSGAGLSLNLGSFAGLSASTIAGQIASKTGTIYNQILIESNYLEEIISHFVNSSTTSVLSKV